VEVLLYIEVAMALTVGCQPEDTCCRCCYVLIVEGVVAADTVATKALALTDHVPADGGVQLLTVALPELFFLVLSAAA
jgi:hypothetical protein